jgi:hypothetical protein
MGRFSQKVQIFIFGISLGLLIGCLFFIFKLDDFFSKASLFEKENKAKVHEELVQESSTGKSVSEDKKQKKKTKIISTNTDSNLISSYSNTNNNEVAVSDDENINVLKEELIGVKNLYLKDYDANSGFKSISDSALTAMSGITSNKKNDFYMIEFWKTPLNSKGYKMTRNRVLIYGLKEKEDLTLIKLNENYYLKNNSEVFKLSYSPDFKPMDRVNETAILQKFN